MVITIIAIAGTAITIVIVNTARFSRWLTNFNVKKTTLREDTCVGSFLWECTNV